MGVYEMVIPTTTSAATNSMHEQIISTLQYLMYTANVYSSYVHYDV